MRSVYVHESSVCLQISLKHVGPLAYADKPRAWKNRKAVMSS